MIKEHDVPGELPGLVRRVVDEQTVREAAGS